MRTPADHGYIVEFVAIGSSVKVTAFDPVSLTEASVVAPASASQQDMAMLAVRKL
ncbi:MAG: DUF6898 family protein, partial [Bacteroidota bacterium]